MAKQPAAASGNRRQQLASLQNQQKSGQRRRTVGLLDALRGAGGRPAVLPDLPGGQGQPGQQRRAGRSGGGRRRGRLRRRGQPPGLGQPEPRGGRYEGPLRPHAAGLRSALRVAGTVHQALLHRRRPARRGDPGAQPGARLHGGLVSRQRAAVRPRTRWRRSPRPSPRRTTTRARSSSPPPGPRPTAPGSRTARTW